MSRTRVVKYCNQLGVEQFRVDRFADFDLIAPNGDKLCTSVGGLIWRPVAVLGRAREAKRLAHDLSLNDTAAEYVVFEFIDGNRLSRISE